VPVVVAAACVAAFLIKSIVFGDVFWGTARNPQLPPLTERATVPDDWTRWAGNVCDRGHKAPAQ
jgi:hypothetical protein